MLSDTRRHQSAFAVIAMSLVYSVASAQDSQSARQTIERALDATASVRYIDRPLSRVLSDLAEMHSISVEFDERVLKDSPNAPSRRVNIELADVSLRSCMSMLLLGYDLGYVNKGSRLLVTTRENAETIQQEDRYKLPRSLGNDTDGFIDLIRDTILVHDSLGTVKIDGNELTVTATRAARAAISQLVEHFQLKKDAGKTPAELEIAQILKQPANMNFILTPLEEAIHNISLSHGVRIVIDRKTLEQAGISADAPVTFELDGVDLGRSLRFLLNSCNLSYVVKHECVQVTTKEVADANRTLAIYRLPASAEPMMQKIHDLLVKRESIARLAQDNRIATFKHHIIVYGTRPVHIATENYVNAVTKRFVARNLDREPARRNGQKGAKKDEERFADPFAG